MDLEEAEAAAPIVPPAGTRTQRLSRRNRIAMGVPFALGVGSGLWTGRLWERRNQAAAIEWLGDRLGGSTIALAPRISPDGHMLAFQAMAQLTMAHLQDVLHGVFA